MSAANPIAEVLARTGAIAIDPPVLQPAHLYLEMAGEDLRRRAFMAADSEGEDLCLRPDMTAPAVRAALTREEWKRGEAFAVRYEGKVFRKRTDDASGAAEFVQAGAEYFFRDGAAIEAKVIATALEACAAAGASPSLRVGDVGVFRALVDACALPEPWGERLKRAFARPGGAAAVLAEAADPPKAESSALAQALASLPPERAAEAVSEALAAARIAPVGGRSVAEIAERLRAKALRAHAAPVDGEKLGMIRSALAVEGNPDAAMATLTRMTRQPGMKLTQFAAAVERCAVRWAEVQKLVAPPAGARFALSLGRGLAYYDGFVFELEAPQLGARAALGGGGRYDGLLHALARRDANAPDVSAWGAAGFALRSQRVADARV